MAEGGGGDPRVNMNSGHIVPLLLRLQSLKLRAGHKARHFKG